MLTAFLAVLKRGNDRFCLYGSVSCRVRQPRNATIRSEPGRETDGRAKSEIECLPDEEITTQDWKRLVTFDGIT